MQLSPYTRDLVECRRGGGPDGPQIARRRELAADTLAARRLTTLTQLADALAWARAPEEVAAELEVTLPVLRRRFAMLTDDEQAFIEERAWRRSRSNMSAKHRHSTLGAIGVAALLAVTSCGGGGSPESQAPSTATTSPTPSAPATAEAPQATVSQYASIVGEQRQDYAHSVAKLDDCFGDEDDQPICGLLAYNVELQAETLGIVLKGADSTKSTEYIGPPPDEISDLTQETIDAAQAVVDEYASWDKLKCPQSKKCFDAWFTMQHAMGTLGKKFDGWDPYL